MKAIMLAAGEGTRCFPFTYLVPKVFQQVCGIPLLEYMLSWFFGAPEIEKLYVVVRNESIAETLKNYIQKRTSYLNVIIELFNRLGYQVEYINTGLDIEVIKAKGWGTGGDLKIALSKITSADELGEDFLVCYADYVISRRLPSGILSPQLNLSDIIDYHKNCKNILDTVITMALTIVERQEATRFGVAQIEKIQGFNTIRNFIEKPDIKDISEKAAISAGVFIIDSKFALSNINDVFRSEQNVSFEKSLLEQLVKDKKPRLAAYLLDLCSWFDVGTLEQLIGVNVYVASKKASNVDI